jgi:hypothetical protein
MSDKLAVRGVFAPHEKLNLALYWSFKSNFLVLVSYLLEILSAFVHPELFQVARSKRRQLWRTTAVCGTGRFLRFFHVPSTPYELICFFACFS